MSWPAGSSPPTVVLGLGGPWQQRSRPLVRTCLLPAAKEDRGEEEEKKEPPLRLPSLVPEARGPQKRRIARFSISEPALLAPQENILLEGFSKSCNSGVFQRRPPPPPPPFCKSWGSYGAGRVHLPQRQHYRVQNGGRQGFIHFSQAIQSSCKTKAARRHSYNPVLRAEMPQVDLRPSATPICCLSSQPEPLSIVGRPCPLSCGLRPATGAASGPGCAHLHVFLPTGAKGEEVDRESVDEGFMDEQESKIMSLKLQPEGQNMVTQ